jgi:hypothetical protein
MRNVPMRLAVAVTLSLLLGKFYLNLGHLVFWRFELLHQ